MKLNYTLSIHIFTDKKQRTISHNIQTCTFQYFQEKILTLKKLKICRDFLRTFVPVYNDCLFMSMMINDDKPITSLPRTYKYTVTTLLYKVARFTPIIVRPYNPKNNFFFPATSDKLLLKNCFDKPSICNFFLLFLPYVLNQPLHLQHPLHRHFYA
jgi:hypothetical protein